MWLPTTGAVEACCGPLGSDLLAAAVAALRNPHLWLPALALGLALRASDPAPRAWALLVLALGMGSGVLAARSLVGAWSGNAALALTAMLGLVVAAGPSPWRAAQPWTLVLAYLVGGIIGAEAAEGSRAHLLASVGTAGLATTWTAALALAARGFAADVAVRITGSWLAAIGSLALAVRGL